MVRKKKTGKHRKPSARVARKRKEARRDILASAQSILTSGGIEAVTLASVAEQLGLTKQALYHYFPSKEALVRALVTTVLDEEIKALTEAIESTKSKDEVLGALIRAFYDHYIVRLDAFRTVYCRLQLFPPSASAIDDVTLRDEIHPRTRSLFDILETRIAGPRATRGMRQNARRLAFTAWTSALGLMTMIGIADATNDPLSHSHDALLKTLTGAFDKNPEVRVRKTAGE